MGSAEDVLRIARGEIGYSRWNDPEQGTKYGRWYAELTKTPYFGTNGVPYCAMFASWVLAAAGVKCNGMPSASCPSIMAAAGSAALGSKTDAQPGDIVLFDWDGNGNPDHVGIVEKNCGGHLQTIEGNTSSGNSGSQSNGGGVYRRTRPWGSVRMIVRPQYGVPPAPTPKPPLPDALKGYRDLDSESWYVGSLEKAVSAGFIKGFPDGTMRPNDPLARGQAVCLIANAADVEFDHPFSDVTASPYYYDAVAWAKGEGVVSGSGGAFRPDEPCTRAEFCVMLFNWRGGRPGAPDPSGAADWARVPEWARDAVRWAVAGGVMSGVGGKLRPNDPCTRAEGATMLVNLLK